MDKEEAIELITNQLKHTDHFELSFESITEVVGKDGDQIELKPTGNKRLVINLYNIDNE